ACRLRSIWSADLSRSFLGLFASTRLVGPSIALRLDRLLFGSAEHGWSVPETSTFRTHRGRTTQVRSLLAAYRIEENAARMADRSCRACVFAVLPSSVALLRREPRGGRIRFSASAAYERSARRRRPLRPRRLERREGTRPCAVSYPARRRRASVGRRTRRPRGR